MASQSGKRPRTKTAIVFAIISAGLGVAWLSYLSPDHTACSSALVVAVNEAACRSDSLRWFLAWGLVAIGAVLVILALIEYAKAPRGPDASRFCTSCGQLVGPEDKHCRNCGTSTAPTHD